MYLARVILRSSSRILEGMFLINSCMAGQDARYRLSEGSSPLESAYRYQGDERLCPR